MTTPFDFIDSPELSWQASEVVRELDDKPHLLMRIQLRGGSFPQRDSQPFIRVLGRRFAVESWFAEISPDGTSFNGYFPVDAPVSDGVIEYGYGNQVSGRITRRLDPAAIERLDPGLVPRELVRVTTRFVRRKEAGRLPPKLAMPPPRRRRRND